MVFYNLWQDVGEVKVNNVGDEVRPNVERVNQWQTALLRDGSGFYSMPFVFYFEEGNHSLELEYISGDMAIDKLYVSPYNQLSSYKEEDSCTEILPCGILSALTETILLKCSILMRSPSFNCLDGLAGLPFTKTLPWSETSLATVRLFISLDTFKNLSNLT